MKNKNITRVSISDEVVAVIAGIAACEAEGVKCLAGDITGNEITKSGAKKLNKSIKVHMEGRFVKIRIALTVEFGKNISKISEDVQKRISSQVEEMTSLMVTEVNVIIGDVA